MAKTISSEYGKTRTSLLKGGKTYEVEKEFDIKHLNYKMKVGSTMRECEDGLFTAFDNSGEKLFVRFGDIMMRDILQNLKLKENEQPQS